MPRDGTSQDRPPQIMVADQVRRSDIPDCAIVRRPMRGFWRRHATRSGRQLATNEFQYGRERPTADALHTVKPLQTGVTVGPW